MLGWIKDLIKPVTDTIDSLHTSEDEKLSARNALLTLEYGFAGRVLEYQVKLAEMATKVAEAGAKVIQTEAASDSWLTSGWRPLVMVTFTFLIVARWMGWADPDIDKELEIEILGIIKVGLGGYVVLRSLVDKGHLPDMLNTIFQSKALGGVDQKGLEKIKRLLEEQKQGEGK